MLRFLVRLVAFLITVSAFAGETIVDFNYFAFKPTAAFAIWRDGAWRVTVEPIKVGYRAKEFFIDTTGAKQLVPDQCRSVFSAPLPLTANDRPPSFSLPETLLPNHANVQGLSFETPKCAAVLWMSGETWSETFEHTSIKPPQNKSTSVGLLQLFYGENIRQIRFAVAVDDTGIH